MTNVILKLKSDLEGVKNNVEKEKMLVTSKIPFSDNVYKRFFFSD